MKAMCLEEFGGRLQLREVPVPRPNPGEVLVRVRACGVCQTDLKIIEGRHASSPRVRLPHILGHEVAGEIETVGPGVQGFQRGERVVVNIYNTCGSCANCRTGRESLCERLGAWLGFDAAGGMAEFVCVPAKNLIKVTGAVPFAQLAVLGDAVGTSLRAVKTRAEVRPGQTVVISGIGGVGIHAVQIARHPGGEVIALDVVPDKGVLAQRYGAALALDARQNPEAVIREHTGGRGADVALDFTGLPSALATCAAALKPGGRLVMVGYQLNTHLQLPTQTVVLQELEVMGSRYCNKREMEESAAWVASGVVTPVIGCTLPLEEANQGLDMIRRGKGLGRIVLDVMS